MVKISNPSGLTANNFLIETVDLTQRTTLAINATAGTVTDVTGEFLTVDGVGFAVGDVIRISFIDSNNPNNGTATVTAVTATVLTFNNHSGTLTDQAAGTAGNIHRIKKTWQLVAGLDGLDAADGASMIAITSRLQILFDTGGLERFDPPTSEIIFDAQSVGFQNGWEPKDQATIDMVRDGAMTIFDGVTGLVSREYMNIETGPLAQPTHLVWWWFDDGGGTLTDATFVVTPGYVNQLFLIRDVENSITRYQDDFYLKTAEAGYTIDVINLNSELGITTDLKAQRYRSALSNAIDLQLANTTGVPLVADNVIDTQVPYTAITYSTELPSVAETVEGSSFNFDAIIERAGATAQQVHAKLHRLARQWRDAGAGQTPAIRTVDVDSSGRTLFSEYAPAISAFLGEQITFQGYARGTPANENNETVYTDDLGTARRTAREASFTVDFQFGAFLPGGQSADFKVFLAQTYNLDEAVPISDKNAVEISGTVTATGTVSFSISYSTFSQQGHSPSTPIPIVITLSSPGNLQPQAERFTIQDNTTQIFTVRAAQTTAYLAPA